MMNRVDRLKTSGVAPHAGAWIETGHFAGVNGRI